MSQALDLALSTAVMALEGGSLPATALPEGARLGLGRRIRELDASLARASDDMIRKILATIADMPSRVETDPAKLRFALERDVSDLSEFPEWALAAAARAYRKGEIGDGPWRPTTGDLATYARQRVAAHRRERERIERVLRAKIEPPKKPASAEQRKASADRLRALVAEKTLPPVVEPPDLTSLSEKYRSTPCAGLSGVQRSDAAQ